MGPPPGTGAKPPGQRRRRNKPPEARRVEGEPVAAPPLHGRWLKRTREWYAVWARSPMGQTFTEADWQRLQTLAPLVDEYWREPNVKLMAEIRQNEAAFGGTPLDRKRLGIEVVAPEEKPGEKASRFGHLKAV